MYWLNIWTFLKTKLSRSKKFNYIMFISILLCFFFLPRAIFTPIVRPLGDIIITIGGIILSYAVGKYLIKVGFINLK